MYIHIYIYICIYIALSLTTTRGNHDLNDRGLGAGTLGVHFAAPHPHDRGSLRVESVVRPNSATANVRLNVQ